MLILMSALGWYQLKIILTELKIGRVSLWFTKIICFLKITQLTIL